MIIQNMGSNSVDQPAFNPLTGVTLYEEFVGVNLGANVSSNILGLQFTGNAGGGPSSTPAAVAGRMGIMGFNTGTGSNSTGQGGFVSDCMAVYAGIAQVTLSFAVLTPAVLSDGTNEYVMELGFMNQFTNAKSSNAIAIQYRRTDSVNWSAYTSNNGTPTVVTSANSALAVTAASWWNGQIVMNSAGTNIDFYMGPAGSPLIKIGSSTTNLPSISQQCSLNCTIYRAASFALNRQVNIDWLKLDVAFPTSR